MLYLARLERLPALMLSPAFLFGEQGVLEAARLAFEGTWAILDQTSGGNSIKVETFRTLMADSFLIILEILKPVFPGDAFG
jgi:hypothetical protein